ncbi:PilW family protein [Crassaminicella profunda]|uniref:PilW family protein n=1 Tax=Crassaminicella profunda TaxID=1286698 RepID=UPI001CA707EC|nr:prepilin-type N-terminal cleavage/methylation domain-containing protein [Crassaminicella profunda]QZY56982.1 prepilin-type N-terminal cleavage/methylation domain-containing protein [Crassaminicella profunda]
MLSHKRKYNSLLKTNLKNTKGVTLIELLVVLALLGMILSLGYSLNFFGIHTFTKGSIQANVQQKVRLAADFITKEIRYATNLKIIDPSQPIPPKDDIEEDLYYIFINGNTIEHRYKGNSRIITDSIQTLSFERAIEESTKKTIDNILNFEIVGSDKKQTYNMKSEALIINLPKNNKILNENEDKPSIAICYKKTLPIESNPNEQWGDYVLVTNYLKIGGSSNINALDTTSFINGNYTSTGSSYIDASEIYIHDNIKMTGSTRLGKSDNSNSIYVNGDIKLEGTSKIYENLYYTGKIKFPKSWSNGPGNKIDNIDFPDISIPPLKSDSWYSDRGFTSNATTKDTMKYFGDSYTFKSWNSPWNDIFSDVIIVSKKDIKLSGSTRASGILFAPNGKVTITGSASFDGIIIAKEIHLSGSASIKYKPCALNDLPF